MSSPFVRIKEINDLRIIYFRDDGSSSIFLGGKRPWRNNNPGNIAYGNGKLVKELGAIGKAGGFAVFPDYETGRKAIFVVLRQPSFQARTLAKAVETWAPEKHGNDTELYKKQVKAWTGLDPDRKIKDLSEKELEAFVNAIERKEGAKKAGKIIEVPAPRSRGKKQITQVRKNKKGTIVAYYVEEYGWLKKPQAINLASKGEIDAVIATSRAGNLFLRTRPSIEIVNLEDLGLPC